MNLGTARIIQADSRNLPLPDNSVDLICTSPPYFALRSYQDGGTHYAGQIGDEPTPAEFVESLLEVTRECVRVLKPSGSLWVNLGDKYAGQGVMAPNTPPHAGPKDHVRPFAKRQPKTGIPTKSLIGIPWRYALRCIDDLGLILRAEVIWSKPNGLPESVTDRVRRSHEQWFHFTLSPRYFSAVDEIREPHRSEPGREGKGALGGQKSLRPVGPGSGAYNPLGALPGSVWTVPTEPLRVPDHLGVDHFAAFPTAWPKRIIQAWAPEAVCVECKKGRMSHAQETSQRELLGIDQGDRGMSGLRDDDGAAGLRSQGQGNEAVPGVAASGLLDRAGDRRSDEVRRALREVPYAEALGRGRETASERLEAPAVLLRGDLEDSGHVLEALQPVEEARDTAPSVRQARSVGPFCTCPSDVPVTRGVVLDVFGGTGTTAMVAKALGRNGISVDMSADYCRLAEWRVNDRDQLAKVLGIEKVDQPHPDEQSLLDLIEGGAA